MTSNRNVAEEYAQDVHSTAKSGHMFIDQKAIYSYGYHFPIAYRTGKYINGNEIVLFNSYQYSNTTARHKSHVRYALSGSEFVEVPTEALKAYINADLRGNLIESTARHQAIDSLTKTAEELEGKASRARKEWNINFYTQEAKNFRAQIDIVKNILIPLHPKHV